MPVMTDSYRPRVLHRQPKDLLWTVPDAPVCAVRILEAWSFLDLYRYNSHLNGGTLAIGESQYGRDGIGKSGMVRPPWHWGLGESTPSVVLRSVWEFRRDQRLPNAWR